MNPANLIILVISGTLLIALPRRLAAIPVLLVAAYTTRFPIVQLGPANLSVLRVLVILGMFRVLVRGERLANGINSVDRLLFAWAALLILNSVFHTSDAWTYRIGMVLGELGVYVLCRVFLQDLDEVRQVFRVLCVTLVPLAILLLLEKYTVHNFFSIMGFVGLDGQVAMRDGHVRAGGPFAHPILAGTVGALCVPMAVSLWKTHRISALAGLCAGTGILYAATSSSPLMMVGFIGFGLTVWKFRSMLSLIRWGTVAAVIGLDIVMNDPVYFLMRRIDITGGSTGWFRAQIIRGSIEHINEWWAVGTDYTRHWMLSGIPANKNHIDIVNHYLAMGVAGGLPLLFLFVLVLWAAFREIGKSRHEYESQSAERGFFVWTLGAMLFGQAVGFIAISPYDQSASFFYLQLAAVGAIRRPLAVSNTVCSESPGWKHIGWVAAGAPATTNQAGRLRNWGRSATRSETAVNGVPRDRPWSTVRSGPNARARFERP